MKLTEFICPSCQGTLKIDPEHPDKAVCEYCGSIYIIEHDGDSNNVQSAPPPANNLRRIDYTPVAEEDWYAETRQKETVKQKYAIIVLALILMAALILKVTRSNQTVSPRESVKLPEVTSNAGTTDITKTEDQADFSGYLAEALGQYFGVPVENLSVSDYGQIRWIESKTTINSRDIGLSDKNPLSDAEAELIWFSFPRDSGSITREGLEKLTGLKYLNLSDSIHGNILNKIELEGISLYASSPSEVAAVLEHPENLKELELRGSEVNLDGLDAFTSLEGLTIDSSGFSDLRPLVQAKTLKRLVLDLNSQKIDADGLAVLTSLEELTIICSGIRDLNFVESLGNLKNLHIEDGEYMTLDPLSSMTQLEKLTVLDCNELKDMSAVEGLSGLKSLTIEVPYNCPEPDLSALTGLESLYLHGFHETAFLSRLTSLESLTLYSCTVENSTDLSSLNTLKHLTCTAFSASEKDYTFISAFKGLETLNLSGMVTYSDISPLLSMPALKSLNISGMECEIDFSKLSENSVLEELSMDGIKLYENVKVQRDGAFVYVDWDNVDFTEHLDMFENFTSLKKLSLRENKLKDVSFAANLHSLEALDIGDNYVSNISPLASLSQLQLLNCEDNPVSNTRVLPQSVTIITGQN